MPRAEKISKEAYGKTKSHELRVLPIYSPRRAMPLPFMENAAREVLGPTHGTAFAGFGAHRAFRPLHRRTDVVERMYTFTDRKNCSSSRPRPRPGCCALISRARGTPLNLCPNISLSAPCFATSARKKVACASFTRLAANVSARKNPTPTPKSSSCSCSFGRARHQDLYVLQAHWAAVSAVRLAVRPSPLFLRTLNTEKLCENCLRRMDTNPMRVLDCKEDGCQALIAEAPRVVDYICESCREHLGVVSSLLERSGVAYTLNQAGARA